jgi:hypothetical protein
MNFFPICGQSVALSVLLFATMGKWDVFLKAIAFTKIMIGESAKVII